MVISVTVIELFLFSGGHVLVQYASQVLIRPSAHKLFHDFPVSEQQQRRDRADAILDGHVREFVHIDFGKTDIVAIGFREFFERRAPACGRARTIPPRNL